MHKKVKKTKASLIIKIENITYSYILIQEKLDEDAEVTINIHFFRALKEETIYLPSHNSFFLKQQPRDGIRNKMIGMLK